MLYFSKANTKLQKLQAKTGRVIYSFDLLAGWSCPFSKDCKSRIYNTKNGFKLKDGPNTKFRCYAASCEALRTHTYLRHKTNYDTLRRCKTVNQMYRLLQKYIPLSKEIIRLHSSGDFFNQKYFDAVLLLAQNNPKILFYAYTKAIPYWVKRINKIPQNLILNASYGGTQDNLISKYGLKYCKVVFSTDEAKNLKLPIDIDDSIASSRKRGSFALLLHGVQPSKHSKFVFKGKNKTSNTTS